MGAPPMLVHMLTASGAALGLLALQAAVGKDWALMFLWLGVALVVDGVDGMLARRMNVAERLPRWSGDTLDLVVDFTTYVFVPAYAIAAAGVLPGGITVLAGVAIAVSGALYFADRRMKTADNYFRGFPATWSPVAFYLILLQAPPWANATAVAAFVAVTFLPVPFVHPLRVVRLRLVNIALLSLWSVFAVVAIATRMAPPGWIIAGLCVIGVYFLCAGFFRRDDALDVRGGH